MKHHGTLFKQSVILQETHFTIQKVKIRKNFDSGDLMLVESSTTIPAHLVGMGGFTIDSGTYIIHRSRPHVLTKSLRSSSGRAHPLTSQMT